MESGLSDKVKDLITTEGLLMALDKHDVEHQTAETTPHFQWVAEHFATLAVKGDWPNWTSDWHAMAWAICNVALLEGVPRDAVVAALTKIADNAVVDIASHQARAEEENPFTQLMALLEKLSELEEKAHG